MYPKVPNTTNTMVCGEDENSLLLWSVIKSEVIPFSSKSVVHEVTEILQSEKDTVGLRTTHQLVWSERPWGLIAYTAEKKFEAYTRGSLGVKNDWL